MLASRSTAYPACRGPGGLALDFLNLPRLLSPKTTVLRSRRLTVLRRPRPRRGRSSTTEAPFSTGYGCVSTRTRPMARSASCALISMPPTSAAKAAVAEGN